MSKSASLQTPTDIWWKMRIFSSSVSALYDGAAKKNVHTISIIMGAIILKEKDGTASTHTASSHRDRFF